MLCDMVDYVHILDSHMRVHDAWLENMWNLQVCYTPIPTAVKDVILRVPVPLVQTLDDVLVWGGSFDGVYTTSSAYSWLGNNYRSWLVALNFSWVLGFRSLLVGLNQGFSCLQFGGFGVSATIWCWVIGAGLWILSCA
ncbi:hypothetical protein RIF29_38189 [Crotalaria pallida]|uniref:Uncharacterized protein n=1 Tax=Crotalaria pallida TaxID=3830 RepID=A0AAN9DYQ6_CROPI